MKTGPFAVCPVFLRVFAPSREPSPKVAREAAKGAKGEGIE